ncbi:hypothetical protein NQ317_002164, partial [Molorchus minor]
PRIVWLSCAYPTDADVGSSNWVTDVSAPLGVPGFQTCLVHQVLQNVEKEVNLILFSPLHPQHPQLLKQRNTNT